MGRTRVWTTLTTFYPLDKPPLFWGGQYFIGIPKKWTIILLEGGANILKAKQAKKVKQIIVCRHKKENIKSLQQTSR